MQFMVIQLIDKFMFSLKVVTKGMRLILLSMSVLLMSSCEVFGVRGSEEALHTVLYEEGRFQLRQYEESIIAVTRVTGDYKESRNIAFKRLAGYIFGGNTTADKIAMTAPVIEKDSSEEIAMTVPVLESSKEGEWTMTFVLPAKYTLETLPKPNDNKIEIRVLPPKLVASIEYSGLIDQRKIQLNTKELESWIEDRGYVSLSRPYSAAYDPPWTLPFLRRNEVHIEVEK